MISHISEFDSFLHQEAYRLVRPLSGCFELTSQCNLHCRMCYVRTDDKKRQLSYTDWLELAGKCKEAGVLNLQLTGGEIFTLPYFKDLYIELIKMGFLVSLTTNGTLIDEEVIKWLSQYPPNEIQLTLYGASEETYSKLCGDASGYTKAMKAIELLIANKMIPEVRITLTKDNVADYDALFERISQSGLELNIINYVFPSVRSDQKDANEVRLSPAELAEFEKKLADRFGTSQDDACEQDNIKIIKDIDKIEVNEPIRTDLFSCGAGLVAFWVSWDGRLLACGLMDRIGFDLREMAFETAWDELRAYSHRVRDCKMCETCTISQYCMRCPGRLVAETGSTECKAEYLCQLAEERRRVFEMDYKR